MTQLSLFTSQIAQNARPDGPPWLKWTFLGICLALAPVIIYKLHQNGYLKRRR